MEGGGGGNQSENCLRKTVHTLLEGIDVIWWLIRHAIGGNDVPRVSLLLFTRVLWRKLFLPGKCE